MAEFTVREVEGMRQVRIDIRDEVVRSRRGAMSNMRGDITLTPKLPTAQALFRSLFIDEARIRPFYEGTGSVLLQPSLGGYHVLDVAEGETWILEPGAGSNFRTACINPRLPSSIRSSKGNPL
jgi:uncharacterized protein (AIM24 family)